jgi:hypothetical protein
MKIHLINYEQAFNDGILSKFARKMYDELEKTKGITVTMGNVPNPQADVNHHINYAPYRHSKTINTLMVTHIDTPSKIANLRQGMKTADMGICMSDDTKNALIKKGFDKNKLTTVLPAHDGKVRRFQIVSILTNVYPDGCKRAEMITELAKTLDNNKWAFRIMGKDWRDILVPLVANGLQVDYFAEFDADNYQRILESSDYNLYFGEDEGSMGVLDAKNAGLKIIAPNTGFNIDVGVDYPFHTQEELNNVFKELSINPVEDWTWKKYVKEHLKIWKKLV